MIGGSKDFRINFAQIIPFEILNLLTLSFVIILLQDFDELNR